MTDLVCDIVLMETTTDWYVNGEYADTQVSYSWESVCSFGQPSSPTLSVPTGVGSSRIRMLTANCYGCPLNIIIEAYDSNGDPIDLPCPGDPLARMEVMTNNESTASNRYGCVRSGNDCGVKGWHGGIDLQAEIGTPVYSINSGTVRYSIPDNGGDFGNWVVVESNGYLFAYGHLSQASTLRVGDQVDMTTIIGLSGESGNANGYPHLHIGARQVIGTGKSRTGWNNSPKVDIEDFLYTKFSHTHNPLNDC